MEGVFAAHGVEINNSKTAAFQVKSRGSLFLPSERIALNVATCLKYLEDKLDGDRCESWSEHVDSNSKA